MEQQANVSLRTVSKMYREKNITIDILGRICKRWIVPLMMSWNLSPIKRIAISLPMRTAALSSHVKESNCLTDEEEHPA